MHAPAYGDSANRPTSRRVPDNGTTRRLPVLLAASILLGPFSGTMPATAIAQEALPETGIGTEPDDEEARIRRDLQRWRAGETVEGGQLDVSPAPGFNDDELGRLRTLINPDGAISLERVPGEGDGSLVNGSQGETAVEGEALPDLSQDIPGPYPDGEAVTDDDAGATVALTPPGERKPTFRIGFVPRGDVGRLLVDLDPMRKALARLLDRPVEILPIASLSALVDAQVLKRIDLAFMSTSAYVTADQLCRCVEPLVAPLASDGTVASYALIVTRRGSGLSGLADLEGRRIAVAAADSVAGRLYQLASLRADGIDPRIYFGPLTSTGSTVDALLHLRDGRADAAFAWSSLAGPVASGYTRGTFTTLISQGALTMNDIQIVWKSKPLTNGPVSVHKSLDAADKKALTDFLVSIAEKDPGTYDLLDPVYGGGYQPILPSDYHGASVLARQPADGDSESGSEPAAPVAEEKAPGGEEAVPDRQEGRAEPDGGVSAGAAPMPGAPSVTGSSPPVAQEPNPGETIFLPARPRQGGDGNQ